MPLEPFDYETLRKRQQSERSSPRLTKLEPDFYSNLELYLRGMQEDLQREHANNAGSAKATLLQDELTNTRRLAEDLYEHRERKVVAAALSAARGGDGRDGNMLKEEQELYEAFLALLRDTKRRALHGRHVKPAPQAPPPAPVQQQGAQTLAVQAAPAPQPAMAAAPADERLLVRVLEDIGQFAASDLRTYTVRREEVVSLPADTAKILILRGKAVEVATS